MKRKHQDLGDMGSPLIVRLGTNACCLDRWTEREMEGSLLGPRYLGVRHTLGVLLQMQLSEEGRGFVSSPRTSGRQLSCVEEAAPQDPMQPEVYGGEA
jgi:hypothetical protein